jgi:hypothetical protein
VTHFDLTADKDKNLLRQISGQMSVPSYLESDDPDSWLKLDERGRPVFRGMQMFPFWVHIPRCAEQATSPLPVLILGHGLFASPRGHLMTPHQKDLINRMCMVEVAIQWLGMSEPDIPSIATDVLHNLSNLPRITDRVQQAHVNQQALVKMMQGTFLQHPTMQVGGKPVTDGQVMYYLGESMGGIQTTIFAALNLCQPRRRRMVVDDLSAQLKLFGLRRGARAGLCGDAGHSDHDQPVAAPVRLHRSDQLRLHGLR